MFDTIASIVGGYKAGQITAVEAYRLLHALGCEKNISALVALAAGVGVGFAVGDLISDVFDLF